MKRMKLKDSILEYIDATLTMDIMEVAMKQRYEEIRRISIRKEKSKCNYRL